jgi:drug/metabolite transporter (DMT)-like permease
MRAMTSPSHTERQGLWLMTAGGLLLGTLGVFLQEAGQHPLTAVWARCLFGAATLFAWGVASGRLHELRLTARAWVPVAGASALMLLNWVLFFGAIERTSIGVATVVFHVQPLWVIAFGAWWLREPVSRAQVIGALVALGGLALATGLLEGTQAASLGGRYATGLLMCLGASLAYAGVTLIAKGARSVSSYALAMWQCAIGTVALAWWPWLHGLPHAASAWGWLAGMGVIHTGLAYVVLYAGMARLSAGRIALLQFVYPATAIVMDWAVYGRTLSAVQGLGVAMMAAALWSVRRGDERPPAGRDMGDRPSTLPADRDTAAG